MVYCDHEYSHDEKIDYIGGWKKRSNGQYTNEMIGGDSIHYNPGVTLDTISFDFVDSSIKLSMITHEDMVRGYASVFTAYSLDITVSNSI